jgi:hypothetical protein
MFEKLPSFFIMSCHNSTLQKHRKVSYRYYHREIFAKGRDSMF